MSNTMQEYLATATPKQAENLITAFLRVPEDKRSWKPDDKARSAQNQFAECALLNGYTAALIEARQFPIPMGDNAMEMFFRDMAAMEALPWDQLHARLLENTGKVVEAIRATPDDALSIEIDMPWGVQTLGQILAYPNWNMTYHEGQINYIASMLGSLK